jgi:flagellar protein FliL
MVIQLSTRKRTTMTQTDSEEAEAEPKKSKLPLILSVVLALVGGGAGFYLSWSGTILAAAQDDSAEAQEDTASPIDDVAYIPIEPLVISLRKPAKSKHLRFRAQLEVPSRYQADVEKLIPRVTDVLNTYLRAVRVEDFDDPAILVRLRTQMLYRVEMVLGEERVNRLLVMEFVFT